MQQNPRDPHHNNVTVALDRLNQQLEMNTSTIAMIVELIPSVIRDLDATIEEQSKKLDANGIQIDRFQAEVAHLKQNLDCFRDENERLLKAETEHKRIVVNLEAEVARLQKKKRKPLWLRVVSLGTAA